MRSHKNRKKKLQRICVVYRPHKPEALQLAQDVVHWLRNEGMSVFHRSGQHGLRGSEKLSNSRQIDRLDLVIVVGGDGTYLKAIQLLEHREIPVLGVNLGFLGFLTETRVEELYQALELTLAGKMERQTRAMLEVTVQSQRQKPIIYHALNDIVIERGAVSQIINMGVYNDNFLITDLKADGIIIATPTGSTAYNLAAGGPILHPEMKAMVVTPICPHSLTNRPITIPDSMEITIKINEVYQKAVFMVDGQRRIDIDVNDSLIVRRSKRKHIKLTLPKYNYFDLLKEKLRFGQRD